MGGPKNFNLLSDIPFDSGFHKLVLSNLLTIDNIKWNEVATSTACNFNNSSLLCLHFSRMINKIQRILLMAASERVNADEAAPQDSVAVGKKGKY